MVLHVNFLQWCPEYNNVNKTDGPDLVNLVQEFDLSFKPFMSPLLLLTFLSFLIFLFLIVVILW